MSWLNYAQDEVRSFHPEFESAANEALRIVGLGHIYEWIHHLRTPGSTVIPDFVLQRKSGHQWLLAFEMKRRPEAVQSTRNQIQAKGYAETNKFLYAPTAPKYFAISNLETSILFALNRDRPPRECRIQGGSFISGNFSIDSKTSHRSRFISDLIQMINVVVNVMNPEFETVWLAILEEFKAYSDNLPSVSEIYLAEPSTPFWNLVREFFGASLPLDSSRVFFLRCLMAEYLRGSLIKHSHPRASLLPPLNSSQIPSSISNAIDVLRQIDFDTLFDSSASKIYRNLANAHVKQLLSQYVQSITGPTHRIVDLARDRIDSSELLDSVLSTIYPVETQDDLGKVTTDPELAALLAYVTITEPVKYVLDPCCGDGMLLAAAYDRLITLGLDHKAVIGSLRGIEVDIIAVELACIRLALKQPASLSPMPPIAITYGDMFANQDTISKANIILMNPPFKRYEAQDSRQVPQALKDYYARSIQQIDGLPASTIANQANLYNYYMELVLKNTSDGTKVGIILDNKWYNNKQGVALKKLLLQNFEIDGIIEYPHTAFFADWTIATSILVAHKVTQVAPNHAVHFVRCKVDPRSADLNKLADALYNRGLWPTDWTCQTKLQHQLKAEEGWKVYFANQLTKDFRRDDWPTLETLFSGSRRGRLETEEGGVRVFETPFHRSDYGPRRLSMTPPRRRFQTKADRQLTDDENAKLATLAARIPNDFRGRGLRNAHHPHGYELTTDDVERVQTLEPPTLRSHYALLLRDRSPWTNVQDTALDEMRSQPEVNAYITEIEQIVNLTEQVLTRQELWTILREPVAGELIIPRKTREGHRVHINPFFLDLSNRQVRISSNFVTYSDCKAIDPNTDLDRLTAVRLIAAFLVSGFGQLQFEMEGYNREGLLALEKDHLNRIRIFDPRWVRPPKRQAILQAFAQLPYPIRTDRLSPSQPERNILDQLIVEEINARFTIFDVQPLLDEVHIALDEWIIARQP